MQALENVYKFRRDISDWNGFRERVEDRLWPQGSKEVPWSDIRRRSCDRFELGVAPPSSARRPASRDVALAIGEMTGGYIQRGPFPEGSHRHQHPGTPAQLGHGCCPAASQAGPWRPGYMSRDGQATTSSDVIDHNRDLKSTISSSFLAEDTSGEYETGEPVT
ncbi:MAG: hypothetical protein R3A46_05830 [Thermomicrobiales bacterium]